MEYHQEMTARIDAFEKKFRKRLDTKRKEQKQVRTSILYIVRNSQWTEYHSKHLDIDCAKKKECSAQQFIARNLYCRADVQCFACTLQI